jgi:hypothetical protein
MGVGGGHTHISLRSINIQTKTHTDARETHTFTSIAGEATHKKKYTSIYTHKYIHTHKYTHTHTFTSKRASGVHKYTTYTYIYIGIYPGRLLSEVQTYMFLRTYIYKQASIWNEMQYTLTHICRRVSLKVFIWCAYIYPHAHIHKRLQGHNCILPMLEGLHTHAYTHKCTYIRWAIIKRTNTHSHCFL